MATIDRMTVNGSTYEIMDTNARMTVRSVVNPISYTNETGASSNSDYYVNAGDTVVIEIQSYEGTEWLCWVEGYTSEVKYLYSVRKTYWFTPNHSGLLRFREKNNDGSISLLIHAQTVAEVKANQSSAVGIYSIPIKTAKVFNSFDASDNNYNFSAGADIHNYQNYASSSMVAKTSQLIQIRNPDGSLIYNGLDISGKSSVTSSGMCLYTFGVDGKWLNNVRYSDFKARPDPFLATEYYAILVEYPSVLPSAVWTVGNVTIDWLNPVNSAREYVVGAGKDFATLTDALTALANDPAPKVLTIEAGTYDIYEEMGGDDYFNSLPEMENTAWREYCKLIPPNTKIIGKGHVELLFDYPMAKNKDVFSCLNSSTGTYIENIIVKQTGGRYGIHFEGGTLSETYGNTYTLKNVTVITDDANCTLGIGMNQGTRLQFEDCYFARVDRAAGNCLYHHTNHHGTESIDISGCIIDGTVGLQNWANGVNGTKSVNVKITNSYMDTLKVYSTETAVTVTDYSVVTSGVNDYTLTSTNVTPEIMAF